MDEALTVAVVMLGAVAIAAVVVQGLPNITELVRAWRAPASQPPAEPYPPPSPPNGVVRPTGPQSMLSDRGRSAPPAPAGAAGTQTDRRRS
jgi:hypothetical protein